MQYSCKPVTYHARDKSCSSSMIINNGQEISSTTNRWHLVRSPTDPYASIQKAYQPKIHFLQKEVCGA